MPGHRDGVRVYWYPWERDSSGLFPSSQGACSPFPGRVFLRGPRSGPWGGPTLLGASSPSGNVLPRLTACRVLLPRGGPIIAHSAGIAPSNPSARSSLSNWRRIRIIGCRAVTEVKPVEVGFAVRGSVCVLRPILPPGAGGAARPKEERSFLTGIFSCSL